MPVALRQLLMCLIAIVTGLVATTLALFGLVDVQTLNLNDGLPTVAMLTPMIAVVVFWAVMRAFGQQISAAQTFLFGGIAIYAILYLCGRLVGNNITSGQTATMVGAAGLFALAFLFVRYARPKGL